MQLFYMSRSITPLYDARQRLPVDYPMQKGHRTSRRGAALSRLGAITVSLEQSNPTLDPKRTFPMSVNLTEKTRHVSVVLAITLLVFSSCSKPSSPPTTGSDSSQNTSDKTVSDETSETGEVVISQQVADVDCHLAGYVSFQAFLAESDSQYGDT